VNIDLAKISRATIATFVWVVIMAGGANWWSQQQAERATKAERQLRVRSTQWRALAGSQPAPVTNVAAAIEAEVAKIERRANALLRQLNFSGSDPVRGGDVPEARADAFFSIARFMAEQRASAQRAGVEVPETETFSFSAHRNSGPPVEHIATVHRQTLIASQLLQALWQVGPVGFTGLQRENPAIKIELSGGTTDANREGRPEDWFVWPAERSLARDEIVDTLALRIGFVGRTATLRAFLAAIARSKAPLVVREVTVQSLGANGRASGGRRTLEDLFRDETTPGAGETGSETTVPIIPANDAEFTVTVEYLDFVGPALARTAAWAEKGLR
jgi:hypothetical protein